MIVAGRGIYTEKMATDSALINSSMETLSAIGIVKDLLSCGDEGEAQEKEVEAHFNVRTR